MRKRFLRDQLVAAFGQRRQNDQLQVGQVAAQLVKKIPYALPDRLDLARRDISMAGNTDNQGRHGGSGRR